MIKKIIYLSIYQYQRINKPFKAILGMFFQPISQDVKNCRFTPTCSQYALEAIGNLGLIKGALISVKRIIRCHPWSKGGIDPVPANNLTT